MDTNIIFVRLFRLSPPVTVDNPYLLFDEIAEKIGSDDNSNNELIENAYHNITEFYCNEGHSIVIPKLKRDFYCGEFFSANITIYHLQKNISYTNVSIVITIQEGPISSVLFDNKDAPWNNLAFEDYKTVSIKHRVTFEGNNMLTCQVFYSDLNSCISDDNSLKSIQSPIIKTYQFMSVPPIKISHKIIENKDDYWIECSIENISKSSLNINDINICDISKQYCFKKTSISSTDNTIISHQIHPNCIFNCIFKAKKIHLSHHNFHKSKVLGHLFISWVTALGDKGYWDIYSIDLPLLNQSDIQLIVTDVPDRVSVESEFEVKFKCINFTKNTLSPRISFSQNMLIPFYIIGSPYIDLKDIKPSDYQEFSITLISVFPGLHILKSANYCDDQWNVINPLLINRSILISNQIL